MPLSIPYVPNDSICNRTSLRPDTTCTRRSHTRQKSKKLTDETLSEAREHVKRLAANMGGTELRPLLRHIFIKSQVRHIFFYPCCWKCDVNAIGSHRDYSASESCHLHHHRFILTLILSICISLQMDDLSLCLTSPSFSRAPDGEVSSPEETIAIVRDHARAKNIRVFTVGVGAGAEYCSSTVPVHLFVPLPFQFLCLALDRVHTNTGPFLASY